LPSTHRPDYQIGMVGVLGPLLVWLLSPAAATDPWSTATSPAPGPPRSIGGYSRGCIAGASTLPLEGPGWRVMKPARNRYYGHPQLIEVVQRLGGFVNAESLGELRVGDLGQPRGGPAPSGHASHQSGLDADLGYALGARAPGDYWVPMIDRKAMKVLPAFGEAQLRLVREAAMDPRVDRLFVNPVLKQALCERAPKDPAARAWLRRVRPWWGHDEHFHIRLACPTDSPRCAPQAPLAEGDGCGGLDWWFAEKKRRDRQAARDKYKTSVGERPRLPDECDALVSPPPP
jgi:penicillin-insensitive murein endopeptidase